MEEKLEGAKKEEIKTEEVKIEEPKKQEGEIDVWKKLESLETSLSSTMKNLEEMTKKILEMEIEETIPKPPPVVEVERKRSLLSKIWNG